MTSARANEAVARARQEIAQRGLVVTVTKTYYGLVVAQRKYAAAQDAAQQALRFLQITQQQQRLGQVPQVDVIKADIQYRQLDAAFREASLAMDNARLALAVLTFTDLNENFTVVDDLTGVPSLPPFMDVQALAGKMNPDLAAATQALRAAAADVRTAQYAFYPRLVVDAVYGIEANEFALHSRVAAQPELGVLPNLGYFVTASLNVPVWDWGSRRAKLIQADVKRKQAQVTLSFTQRQLASNLYMKYNEAIAARAASTDLQAVADLAAENLRLTVLRYQAGESPAHEVVDAQNILVQARGAADDAQQRYRVALADLQTMTGPF
jgi:outer membrane protein TolC